MLEQFEIFYNNSICNYELYICASVGYQSVLIVIDARYKHEDSSSVFTTKYRSQNLTTKPTNSVYNFTSCVL